MCNCEVVYVDYDPDVHEPGLVAGDGTEASPFQVPIIVPGSDCCVYQFDADYSPADGDAPSGSGTADDPFLLPLPPDPPSFILVDQGDEAAGDGLGGSGTADDPWQVPICCPVVTYVPYDPDVHDAGDVEGSGTEDDPWQIPLPPEDECCVYQFDADYNPADGDTPSGSGTSDDPFLLPLPGDPDGAFFVNVPYDPDVHEDGSIVGAGTETDPIQIPLPPEEEDCPPADLSAAYTPGVPGSGSSGGSADCCCAFDEAAIACAPGLSVLVSDGASCGPTDLGDITPSHAFAACSSPGETIDAVGAGDPPITGVTSTELDRGQVGALVYNTNPFVWPVIPVGTFPMSIPVPPSDPDCILALHVAFGHENTTTFSNELSGPSLDGSGAADLTNQATAVDTAPGASMSGQAVYVFDPSTGAGGGTVDLDFAINGAEGDGGSVQWYWDEICAASGPIEVADLDLGNVVSSVIAGQPASDGVGTSSPIDTGGCDAIVFATARHVTSPSNSNALHVDSDWFGISAGSEIYDTASTDCDFTSGADPDGCCQHGSAHAVVPAGSGAWTWTYTTNAQWQNGIADSAKLSAIPIVCESDGGGGSVDSTSQCSVEISNPNCAVDGVVRCSMRGSAKICIPDGETADISVVPVLDGVELADQALGLEATGAMCTTIPVAFSVTDLASPLAPGASTTKTFGWRVAGGVGTVELSDWVSECEVIHL